MKTTNNTTNMLERIEQELTQNPYDKHKLIAERLSIDPRVVSMVCRNTHLPCKHGKSTKPRMSGGVKQRQASININDDDWKKFKDKYPSAAVRLGEMVREDIKDML